VGHHSETVLVRDQQWEMEVIQNSETVLETDQQWDRTVILC
jgi:hypothetical protein